VAEGVAGPGWGALLWFLAIIAAIPVALWLFKRSPLGMAGSGMAGSARAIGMLPLAGGQRVVTVEVGQGEDRRWLVLGVTAQHITTLHTMAPQDAAPAAAGAPAPGGGSAPGFAALLGQFRAQLSHPRARLAAQHPAQAETSAAAPAPAHTPAGLQAQPHAR
jgi:flagellar protein FliO/FliZ